MMLDTGLWAKFTFINKMNALNGIYQKVGEENFETTISDKVDYVKTLYTSAGLTEDDWKTDYPTYANQSVYWLQPADSSKAKIPVPVNLISTIPDISVGKYYNYAVVLTLGLYDKPDSLLSMVNQLNDIVTATTGKQSNIYWTASSSGAIYKTADEYAALDKERKAKAIALEPLSVQLYKLNQQIDDLKARNDYLEKIVIEAANS